MKENDIIYKNLWERTLDKWQIRPHTRREQRAESREQRAESLNNALVSIIIPAYNTEKYIYRAIESSIRQTYKNIEIIIIDDGSTDNTLKAAQKYNYDKRVRIFQQDNNGVSSARNYGIREAKGEYIIFLDSDDWLEDDAVELFINTQSEYPGKLVIFATKLYNKERINNTTPQKLIRNTKDAIINFSTSHLGAVYPKIFAKKIILDNKIFFREDIHNHEDGLFVFEYIHYTDGIIYTDTPIYNCYPRPDSATRVKFKRRMAESVVKADTIMINYPGNSPEEKESIIIWHHVNSLVSILDKAIFDNAPDEDIIYIREHIRPYLKIYISVSKISLRRKIKLLYQCLLPVKISRFIKISTYITKQIIKKILGPFIKRYR